MNAAIAPLVLFDLDGTLVDSALDLHRAMERLAGAERHPVPPLEQFRCVVSKGAMAMLALTYPGIDAAGRLTRLQPFLDHYADTIEDNPVAYPGIDAVLAHIEAAGSRWGIVTNKPAALALRVVHRMDWSRRAAVVVGGDTLAVKKPHPGPLLHACESLVVDPADTVYVGDDLRDVLAARAAGIVSVAVAWGYREAGESPADWGADRLVDLPLELLEPGVLDCAAAGTTAPAGP